MNEVSIIINGVKYDVIKANTEFVCEECNLRHLCEKSKYSLCLILDIEKNKRFKKSDKKFE